AGALVERGLTGRTVGTLLLNEPDTLVTYLGLARAGGVNVPVNVRLSSREQEYVLTDAGASCLVVDREYLAQVRELRARLPEVRDVVVCGAGQDELEDEVAFGTLLRGDRPDERDLPRCEDGSPATITYTAGTTGFPKGVVRTHGANLWNVANSALGSPRSTDDVEVFTLPIFGIGFLHFAMAAFIGGATVVLDRAFDASRCWQLIAAHRPTRIFLAPTMVDLMLRRPSDERCDVSSLEVIYSAYEFPKRLRDEALAFFGDKFVYMYGLTEAQLVCGRLGSFAANPTCVGGPMGPMRVRVVGDDGRPLPAGEVGEIVMDGPALMSGYHRLPDATAESLRDGWLHTGDLGYLDDENELHFTGRRKELIKTGGFSVDPREVENVLLDLPGVREAAVIGTPDDRWGEMVVAFVATEEGSDLDEAQLDQHCRTALADFKVPKTVSVVDELPKNPTGKVERGRLRTLAAGRDAR
ncbi:MAG: AMP-binding protein, partial [Pseudonocardiaceae bacterium]|nr:AMP-binding protein [Pseudonocardiaceae bacterium]